MVSVVNGVAGATSMLTSFIKESGTMQAVDIAVIKKGRDVEKATGEAALRLIESATDQKIDVHV